MGCSKGTGTSCFQIIRNARRTCSWRCCTSMESKTSRSTTPRDARWEPKNRSVPAPSRCRSDLMRCVFIIGLLGVLPLAGQIGGRATRPKIERPDGPVWDVIRKNCTACHGIDDYAFYALDKAAWSKLIASKHKPGDADLSDADRNLLLDYLAERFGPGTKPFP